MADKPAFDPSQPFQAVGDKPAFDPSQPFQAADAPSVGVGEDMAKTVVPSIGRMVAGTVGLPGDIGSLAKTVGDKLPDVPTSSDTILGRLAQFLKDESAKSANLPAAQGSGDLPGSYVPPTSAQLQGSMEGATGSYQPQTEPGRILDKAIQFAPAAIGGPETLATKALTRVIAPAVTSEAAGKLAEGTAAAPYAEIAGALTGAAGASGVANKLRSMSAARTAQAAIPEVADIKAAARAQYQHPDVQAVQIKPNVASDLADTISTDLQHGQNSGFRPANEPKVFNAIDELKNAANEGRPATVADLDSVRQVLGNAGKEKDITGSLTRQAVAANRAIDHIDNFLPNLKQTDLIAGDAAKANTILDTARQNWGAAKRAENVQTLAKNAEINAASSHSGANIQNATKQAFKPLLKNNAAKAIGYNDEEKAALSSIVRGTWTGHIARAAGNVLGGGGGLGMLLGAGAGYEGGGVPGAIAGAAAGRAFKMIGNKSTFNAVQKLDSLIRSRAPEAIRIAAQNPQLANVLPPTSVRMLRTMILSEPSLRSENQKRQPVGQTGTY
jgi:hypothetical protein